MKRNSVQKLRSFFQNQVGRFLATQLTHTVITAVILIGFFFGATQVGALDSVLAPAAQTAGASFTTINYQGRLADPDGAPISDTLTFQFALYDAPSDGNLLWGPEVHADVPVSDGLFSVRLGQQEALPTNIFNGGDVWLETTVKGETLSPREKLAAVPYAMVAGEVLTVSSLDAPDGDPQDAVVVNNEGDVSVGVEEPNNRLHVGNGGIDIGNARNSNSTRKGLNFRAGSTNIQLATDGWGRSHGILFNAYKKSEYVDGSLFASGNIAHTDDVGDHGGGAGAIGFISNGGSMRFYISPTSTGQDTDVEWGDPKMSILRNGDVEIAGDFTAGGTKSAVVETESYGERKLYAFEQPTNRFGDEGRAELVDGAARVELDPIFLETVEDDFLIHLTPYGDASLYVAEIGADYFVVQAREGADDVPFAWMLTATRSGYEGVRLEEVD